MRWPQRIVSRHLELIAVLLIVASVALIHFFADHKLVALNILYVPVLVIAFFFGRRLGALAVLICFLLVVGSAMLAPRAYDIRVTPQLLALDLVIWGGLLALAVHMVGVLSEWRQARRRAAQSGEQTGRWSNRRRSIRVNTALSIEYQYLGESAELLESGRRRGEACNISRGGMELQVDVPPESIASKVLQRLLPVYVEVPLPNSNTPVRTVGRVAWLQPRTVTPPKYRMGLEFREMTRADEDRIVRYIIDQRICAVEDPGPQREADGNPEPMECGVPLSPKPFTRRSA